MPAPLLLFLLFARPFWEVRPPAEWTNPEVKAMLTESPWVQGVGPQPFVQAVLATARPIELAEAEARRRGMINPSNGARPADSPDIDYTDFLKQNRGEDFVLAIPYPTLAALGLEEEQSRLEAECVMRIGRKQYRLVGHFPPTPSDPVLRLIFPRAATASDRSVSFDLYLPGISQPSRMVEFRIRDLMYHGRLEM